MLLCSEPFLSRCLCVSADFPFFLIRMWLIEEMYFGVGRKISRPSNFTRCVALIIAGVHLKRGCVRHWECLGPLITAPNVTSTDRSDNLNNFQFTAPNNECAQRHSQGQAICVNGGSSNRVIREWNGERDSVQLISSCCFELEPFNQCFLRDHIRNASELDLSRCSRSIPAFCLSFFFAH